MMDQAVVSLITGRLDSIDRAINEERRDSAESRRRVYEKLEGQDSKLERLDARVETLERTILTMSPTVAEFVDYKAQVRGAGRLGRFLWVCGGFLLTAASSFVAAYAWLAGLFTSGKP